MRISHRSMATWLFLTAVVSGLARSEAADSADASEQLKMAAIEALISAPPGKALPIVARVLSGDGSVALKERALFILSQVDLPEAQSLLVETARSADDPLRREAIRMIGIQGDPQTMTRLAELYDAGDADTRSAVLEAYLIADDEDAVYRIAANAQDAQEFEAAVEVLGAMDALEQLRSLSNRADMSESLIQAYAIAGDTQTLRQLAEDPSDPARQVQAIQGLGIIGGSEVVETLAGIYRAADSPEVRDAAREGLLIADDEEALLTLFRESQSSADKQALLETLVNMDSQAVWDIIDDTLQSGQ